MSVKGGYHILNLQNKDLQYSPTIPGAYESVEGSYQKPILLSGIVIGGVEKADVYRMPVVSGSSYVFENVYGYDLTLTDSDGFSLASTQWATRNYVDGKAQFENIVDADGNKRFIEGDLEILDNNAGLTITYKKWSLSGTHLMIVCAGTIADTTVLTYTDLFKATLPAWIMNKIYPTAGLLISLGSVKVVADDYTAQDLSYNFWKYPTYVSLTHGGLTLTADRSFRIQLDLLIDNE